MKKIVSTIALALLVCIGWMSPSEAYEPEPQTASTECVGQITGPGTAEVTGDCMLLAYSYSPTATVPGSFPDSLPQSLFTMVRGTGTLSVALPPCLWQVDLVDGDAVVVDTLVREYYGPNGWLVDYEHGGAICEEVVTTTTTTTSTSTTVPHTTTTVTVPETSTTVTTPSTIQSNPPTTVTTALARTGLADYHDTFVVVFGMAIAGLALIYLGHSYGKQYG